MALSGVENPGDLCILPPDDADDFSILPPFDVDVVQILETMQSFRPLSIPQNSPGGNVESSIVSIDPPNATLSDEFPCPNNYFDAPMDQIGCVSCRDHDVVETFDPHPAEIPLNVQIMDGSLRTNKCFDLIASEIYSIQSLSPDLLCLLRHFSVRYLKPTAQIPY
jgi:hypothetical protein